MNLKTDQPVSDSLIYSNSFPALLPYCYSCILVVCLLQITVPGCYNRLSHCYNTVPRC